MIVYIIIFILISIFILNLKKNNRVKIIINSETFIVNKSNNEDELTKAILIYNMKQKLATLVEYMYANNIPTAEYASTLKERFYKIKFSEIESTEDSVAYTLNKSDEIRICLTKLSDSSNGEYYDEDLILFILLHELAHVMSTEYGHESEFQNNMDIIVREAVKIGIYVPRDFNKYPGKYCGTYIYSSPCNDGMCPLN